MKDIEKTIEQINYLIEYNDALVKKGSSDSLAVKYFFITKDMSHYIKSIVNHNKDSFLTLVKEKKSLKIIDLFAGSAMFTLIFSKYLLEILLENKIKIENFLIILNDKMYDNTKIINWKNLETNFFNIVKNLSSRDFIKLVSLDLSKKENVNLVFLDENDVNIAIANPMFLSISKGKEHYKPIVFSNEDVFLQNEGIKQLIIDVIAKIDCFLYLTKQQESHLKLESHKNRIAYKNDYSNLTITETDKQRYEIFQDSLDELEKMRNEDFWKFTNNQKENFNTIIFFSKGNSIGKEYRYIYKNILDNKNKRLLESKINKIKTFQKNITLEDTINKYEDLKGLL